MKSFNLHPVAALVMAAFFCGPVFGAEQILLETRQARITSADFEAGLARIPEESRDEVLASKARIRKILENLIITKTLAAQARKEGTDKDPALRRQVELAEENVLAQAQVNRKINALKLPNFETRAHEIYLLDIKKYTSPARVHASHILVEAKNRTPEEALKRIEELRGQALGGTPFEALAEEFSDDQSAKNNKGDLGFFEPGRMVKPFSDVAFAMSKAGEISAPVKTQFGYHIIQFHEKQPQHTRPFEEVKADIVKSLRDKYIAEYRQSLAAEIINDPAMKLNEAEVNRYLTHQDDASLEQVKK